MLRKKDLQASDQTADQSDDSSGWPVASSETNMWRYAAQLGASWGGGAAGPQASHQASQSMMPSDEGDTRAGAGTQAAADAPAAPTVFASISTRAEQTIAQGAFGSTPEPSFALTSGIAFGSSTLGLGVHQQLSDNAAGEDSIVSMMTLTDVTRNGALSPNFTPSDDLFGNQWHLLNTGQFGGTPGIDLNVTRAWDNYTGAGVHVGIYDSGVQYTHHDLNDNYDASRSVIVDGSPHDPAPDLTVADNAHGTNVAGLIAAENDGTGTVGVAFHASITGINIFALNDAQFLQAWGQMTNFDVTNHSWGFTHEFADSRLAPAGSFFSSFFADIDNAVQSGRGGLGTIIVHAAGNERRDLFELRNPPSHNDARDANDSNFTNSREVISVAALDNHGFVTQYSTPGAPILVSAFGGGIDTPGVWSTDFLGNQGFNQGPGDGFAGDDSTLDYDGTMNGTSAATPEVAGVVALMLQANPSLGWRDVQEILAITARHTGSDIGSAPTGWELYSQGFNHALDWNGGGLHFDNDYGFGLVDATAAVRLAETWTQQSTSSNEFVITTGLQAVNLAVPDNNPAGVSFLVNAPDINVEHLELELDWSPNHTFLGDLVITVTSPTGTVSTLLNREGTAFGSSTFGLAQTLPNWIFTSNAFRDESGQTGANRWTVTISDNAAGDTGTITNANFSLFGSAPSANDTYYYTNEYGIYAGLFSHTTVLSDPDGGTNTINASAVTSNSVIDLNPGVAGSIAGQSFSIASGTTIQIVYGGDGSDTLTANSAGDQLYGERGDDTIVGGSGNDYVDGGDGNDTLSDGQGTDTVFGGNGDDHLVPTDFSPSHHDFWDGGLGIDTWDASAVTFVSGVVISLAAHNWTFSGSAASIYNVENVEGSQGGETIVGDDNANVLDGNGGDDVIDGGTGADVMTGGAGNDTFYVDNAADQVNEAVGGGADTVFASVNYALQAGQEVEFLRANAGATGLTLTGNEFSNTIFGGTGNDTLNGAAGDDPLYGGDGNDILNGGVGADVMQGGAGDDTYYVDNAADQAIEAVGAGTDTVYASVNYALQAGREIEFLRANAGATGLTLTGNAFSNTIFGGTGNDTLNGAAGNDQLYGGVGNDILNGGVGADVMQGGAGNDTYYVDNAADQAIEAVGAGTDTVYASVNYALQAGREIEFLRANAGATGLTLTGNAFSNTIFGGTGNDTLNGAAGNDQLYGGVGNDILNGGVGADVMQGGAGNDTYYVDNAADQAIEAVGAGTDTVYASVNYALQAGREIEFLRANAGATGLTLTGNAFSNTIFGGTGNDTLNGAAGNDQLYGGVGNDILNGGVGADVMQGGAGDDTYYVDNAADQAIEAVGAGTDTVYASVNYALQAGREIEFLRANAGATGLTLTGNEFSNTIFGGTGNDTLNGAAGDDPLYGGVGNDILNGGVGADVMQGGAGDDTYYVDNAADQAIEAVGAGTDTVYAGVNYALQAGREIEFLRANAGATGLTLTGNAFSNTIVGGTGNDTLNGGAGNDQLNGGAGNDQLNGGAGNDQITCGAGVDSIAFNAALDAALNVDHIVDFVPVDDTMRLENSIFTALTTTGTLAANAFFAGAGANTAHDADDRIIYNTTTGGLFYDADGIGGGAAIEFAVLNTHPAITNADFQVV